MLSCQVCNKILEGRQTKFCSHNCKNLNLNLKYKNYESQKNKGLKNKIKLLELKGKYCSKCGYDKNTAALCFHHLRNKLFGIDIRRCSNTSWKKLVEEVDKCIVLCHNCHMEEHYPEHMVGRPGFEPRTDEL